MATARDSAGPFLIRAPLACVVRAAMTDAVKARKLLMRNPQGPVTVTTTDRHAGPAGYASATIRLLFDEVPAGTSLTVEARARTFGRASAHANADAPGVAADLERRARAMAGLDPLG